MASSSSSDSESATFEEQFAAFAKFGESSSKGDAISLRNSDKWMKQAKVIDNKKISTTDTGIYFSKVSQNKKTINLATYKEFLSTLATNKKVEVAELEKKLTNCGAPGMDKTTKTVAVGGVDRLTDTSKYTGSHKERFDESGKGKGISGREDLADTSGYVQGYKEKDTYDKQH